MPDGESWSDIGLVFETNFDVLEFGDKSGGVEVIFLVFLNFGVLEFGDKNDCVEVIFLVWLEFVPDRKSWSDVGLVFESSMIGRGLAQF